LSEGYEILHLLGIVLHVGEIGEGIMADSVTTGVAAGVAIDIVILASECEDICDLVLPNCADASSCGGDHCIDTRLVTEKTDICPVMNTLAI
jgi:hypothetical protein